MANNRNILRVSKTLVAAVLMLTVIGCGGSSGEAKGKALDGPSEIMAVYRANCINCHGTDLQGRVGPNTNLQQVGNRMTASEIVTQLEEGEGSMPAFKDRLTAEEIAGLADWLAGKK